MAIRDNLLTAAQKSGYMLEDKIDLSEYYLNEFNMPRYYFKVQKDGIIVINTNSDIIEETETYIAATVQDNGENIGYRFTPNTKYDTRTIEVFKDQIFSLSTHKTSDNSYIDHQFDWIYFYPYKASGNGASTSGIIVNNTTVNGMSNAAKTLLITILENAVYTSDQSRNISLLKDALNEQSEEEGGESSGETTEKTLVSISAVYTGGNVEVGTDISTLSGIYVTANYSDGSSEYVTGYTLSGTIVADASTITVSYGGKTTTFVVFGVSPNIPDNPDDQTDYITQNGTELTILGGVSVSQNGTELIIS